MGPKPAQEDDRKTGSSLQAIQHPGDLALGFGKDRLRGRVGAGGHLGRKGGKIHWPRGEGVGHDPAGTADVVKHPGQKRSHWHDAIMGAERMRKKRATKRGRAALIPKKKAIAAVLSDRSAALHGEDRARADGRKDAVLIAKRAVGGGDGVGHDPDCGVRQGFCQPFRRAGQVCPGKAKDSTADVRAGRARLPQRPFDGKADVACSAIGVGGDVGRPRLTPAKDVAGKVSHRCPAPGSPAIDAQDKLHLESPFAQEYQSNTIMRSVIAFRPGMAFCRREIRWNRLELRPSKVLLYNWYCFGIVRERGGIRWTRDRPSLGIRHHLAFTRGGPERCCPIFWRPSRRPCGRWSLPFRVGYAGAGSSGLMALADALELPGTFGIPPDRVPVLFAGGTAALLHMTGAVEDDPALALADLDASGLTSGDMIVILSASGTTPYALVLAKAAAARGIRVAGIANVPGSALLKHVEDAVLLDTGPEVVSGSTRMGAGSAQKVALNMLSTLIGIKLGHVHDGYMVNVVADNAKLMDRAARIVADIAGVPRSIAEAALTATGGAVKPAVLVAQGQSPEAARDRLTKAGGHLALVPND